jgi:rhodanese-related sulfurtransferase
VALTLADHGYRAAALAGGFDAWKAAGCPLVPVQLHPRESVETLN